MTKQSEMSDSTRACLSGEELAEIEHYLRFVTDGGMDHDGPELMELLKGTHRAAKSLLSHIASLSTRTSGMTEDVYYILARIVNEMHGCGCNDHAVRFGKEDYRKLDSYLNSLKGVELAAVSQLSQGNGAAEMRDAAAMACDKVGSEVSREARKANPYSEGFSDGADECASRIRALPLPPSSEEVTEEEVEAACSAYERHIYLATGKSVFVTKAGMRSTLLAARKARG